MTQSPRELLAEAVRDLQSYMEAEAASGTREFDVDSALLETNQAIPSGYPPSPRGEHPPLAKTPSISRKPKPEGRVGMTASAESMEDIRTDLGDCTRCRLCKRRKSIVFGVGNPDADLVIVGEAPGRDEDHQGVPFVGRAGQLLTRMLEAIGLSREEVYICNVIKCRPPENRNPLPDEVESCEPFLIRQLLSLRPKMILAMGKFAAQTLLATDERISSLRGHFREYQEIPVMSTFHPAYLLRNPSQKRVVWEDLQKVHQALGLPPLPSADRNRS